MRAVIVLEIDPENMQDALNAIMVAVGKVNEDERFVIGAHVAIEEPAQKVLDVFNDA